MNDNKKLGNAGEQFIASFLEHQGFTICEQNYRKFFGEIDIIASKKNLYIFVEVKTRKSADMPMGNLVSVTKQTKIIKTAQTFMAENQLAQNNVCRFDVALLIKNGDTFSMEYIENAFTKKETHGYEYY